MEDHGAAELHQTQNRSDNEQRDDGQGYYQILANDRPAGAADAKHAVQIDVSRIWEVELFGAENQED